MGKKVVSICGKQILTTGASDCKANVNGTSSDESPNKKSKSVAPAPPPPDRQPIPESEVIRVASSKSENLHSMLAKQIDAHVQQSRAASTADRRSMAFNDEVWKELPRHEEASGFAEIAETEWDVMTEKHLGPVQRAELMHVRNMMSSLKQQIRTLNDSLVAFERAEREILLTAGPKS